MLIVLSQIDTLKKSHCTQRLECQTLCLFFLKFLLRQLAIKAGYHIWSKIRQIGTKCDKSGTFKISFSTFYVQSKSQIYPIRD